MKETQGKCDNCNGKGWIPLKILGGSKLWCWKCSPHENHNQPNIQMKSKKIPQDRIHEYANEVASSGWLVSFRSDIQNAINNLTRARYDICALRLDPRSLEDAIEFAEKSIKEVDDFLNTNTED